MKRRWIIPAEVLAIVAVVLFAAFAAQAATISGTVNQDGVSSPSFPSGTTYVVVYGPSSNGCSAAFLTYGEVKTDGTFSIIGIPPHSTQKYFLKTWSTLPYVDEWFAKDSSGYTLGSYNCNDAYGISLPSASSKETNATVSLGQAQFITGWVQGNIDVVHSELQKATYVLALQQTTDLTDGCTSPIYSISALTNGTTPSTAGTYNTDSLPPGVYYLRTYSPENYLSYWYTDTGSNVDCSTATPITVQNVGTEISNQNFMINTSQGGTISGTVEIDEGGTTTTTGVEKVVINVYQYNDSSTSECKQGIWVTTAFVDSTGAYTTPKLISGDYLLQSYDTSESPQFMNEWISASSEGDYLCKNAAKITVSDGNTVPNKNFKLDKKITTGLIKGTIKDIDSSAGIPGITVNAYQYFENGSSNSCHAQKLAASATTDSDGKYSLSGLSNGDYLIQAVDGTEAYLTNWYFLNPEPTKYNYNCVNATSVRISIDTQTATGKDISLKKSNTYSISGNVSASSGTIDYNNVDIYINVFKKADPCTSSEWVTSTIVTSGTYKTPGVENGDYLLQSYSVPKGTTPESYVNEWYSISKNAYFCTDADTVTVNNAARSGIDFSLDKE